VPMPVAYAVDANVLLRFVLGDHDELSAKSQAVFAAAEAGEVTLACDPVNLAEAIWVLSSHYKASREHIAEALLPLVKMAGLQMPDKGRYVRALELYGQGVLGFGDACACATAEATSEGRLVSFDRALSRAPGIARVEVVSAEKT
jgi:predicted nucleic acid-binding protein